MRSSPLRNLLAKSGAIFAGRYGAEVVQSFTDAKTEYLRIREAAALTDFSFLQAYRIPEATAIDFLDSLLAGNVARTRFGRVLHTFLADEDGYVTADCLAANNDDEFLLLCESLLDHAQLNEVLRSCGAENAGVEDLTQSHAILSIDGFKAWAVVKELFGADVLGLPYLSIETYPFEGAKVRLFRAGKTSEFGYLLLAPQDVAEPLFVEAAKLVEKQGGGLTGVAIHNDLRLEGRFFNIHAEGRLVKDPLPLGLQWMIDFDKETFRGSAPIRARRQAGVNKKIIGILSDALLKPGASIYAPGGKVAETVVSCFSHALNAYVGLALFPVDIAFAGLTLHIDSAQGPMVRTISMPPIMPKSLGVKLDEM